ncbi:GNAT family N-acetyltransferase [Dichotomicrobium thermohalophilum]|uniref:Putative acetyltransferase n=1 Tax=Dichotomicrobium thermohalophilum TaxID=933063 RepID=A0A397Q273_9HYPH|nr:N-acetyltransferase [Dichotomicrobium thermohalophilum]RIA55158.1 putative acetyltransferase [Dichotomicrobium thermohalophilum]
MADSDQRLRHLDIREGTPDDFQTLARIYREAFPEEDLLPLVRALLQDGSGVLSLVATVLSTVVGHVIFTSCRVTGQADKVALLGPLAVAPDWQRRGIGTALTHQGLDRLERASVSRVFVLGDPGYYSRAGFAPETHVTPPYPLPEEWRTGWQSLRLSETELEGALEVPAPWRRAALWLP